VDRRNFLKASTLTAGATLLPNVLVQAHTAQGLRTVPMNRGWRFSPKVVEGDTRREFDDTAFTPVVIPHTNKVLPWLWFAKTLAAFEINDIAALPPLFCYNS